MTTVLLVRHGRTTANASGVLAGWTPGVHLDDQGRRQAEALGQRLRPVPLSAVVCSPLERCQETAAAIMEAREGGSGASGTGAGLPDAGQDGAGNAGRGSPVQVAIDDRVGECHYGDWNGQRLERLAKEDLWQVVQTHPSMATFPGPGGESLRDTQHRALDAIHSWNSRLGDEATYAVCSHGDVLKAVIAEALGMHLDLFQRIQVGPASLTVIQYTRLRPFVLRINDTGGSVDDLVPKPPEPPEPKRRWWDRRRRSTSVSTSSDAVVGGGSGST